MSSLIPHTALRTALQALRSVNATLGLPQGQDGARLQSRSSQADAVEVLIPEAMTHDSATAAAIGEGLTLTKIALATAHRGAEAITEMAKDFTDHLARAQGNAEGLREIEQNLQSLVKDMRMTLTQSTFNGDDMLAAGASANASPARASSPGSGIDLAPPLADLWPDIAGGGIDLPAGVAPNLAPSVALDLSFLRTLPSASADNSEAAMTRMVLTSISRVGTRYETSTIAVQTVDLLRLVDAFDALSTGFAARAAAVNGDAFVTETLKAAQAVYADTVTETSKLAQAQTAIENQQASLRQRAAQTDAGAGAVIDPDIEAETALEQAREIQQQLASQSLSIANHGPQTLAALFR